VVAEGDVSVVAKEAQLTLYGRAELHTVCDAMGDVDRIKATLCSSQPPKSEEQSGALV